MLIVLPALTSSGEAKTPELYVIESEVGSPDALASLVAASGGELLWSHRETGLATARSDGEDFVSKLERKRGIVSVAADPLTQWLPEPQGFELESAVAVKGHVPPLFDPTTASLFPCQWNLEAVGVPDAWAQHHFGDPDVKVAVLDSGVDPFHVDLAGRVDLTYSTSVLTPGSSPCGATDESTIYDYYFHGSFVSGIITTNGIGIAGVAPLSRVVAVKVVNCAGGSRFGDIIRGITYAAMVPGVEIINMSLQEYVSRNDKSAGSLVRAMTKAINFAVSKGVLVVAAAGNDQIDLGSDENLIAVPAELGDAISVYATNILDERSFYTNYGRPGTLLGAPGGDFPHPVAALPGCPVTALSPVIVQSTVYSVCSSFIGPFCQSGNVYIRSQGTSFATPVVAGIAALVDGKHGGKLTGAQLKAILTRTAEDIGDLGVDDLFSHGRVSACEAVQY
jgi:subtilisin family serine protease